MHPLNFLPLSSVGLNQAAAAAEPLISAGLKCTVVTCKTVTCEGAGHTVGLLHGPQYSYSRFIYLSAAQKPEYTEIHTRTRSRYVDQPVYWALVGIWSGGQQHICAAGVMWKPLSRCYYSFVYLPSCRRHYYSFWTTQKSN